MKLTKNIVKQFESDQKESGTQIALKNFQWSIAASILKGIGVKNIKTTYWRTDK